MNTMRGGVTKRCSNWLLLLAFGAVLAACGGGGGNPGAVAGVTPGTGTTTSVASVVLAPSSINLGSSNATPVTIVALVKDSANAVVPSASVVFSSTSGALDQGAVATDAKGQATVTLGTSADPTLRAITVTATVGGKSASTVINVIGTKLSITANNTLNLGSSTDLTVKLVDSAGAALVSRAVVFSAVSNPVTVKGGGAAVTDANGQLVLTYTANANPSSHTDAVTVTSMAAAASTVMAINASNFNVKVVSGATTLTEAPVNTCQKVTIHNDIAGVAQVGNVSLGTSRGNVFSDIGCATALGGALALNGSGDATAYVKSANPGLASLTATYGAVVVQGTVEFVAPLTASATITAQASPAIVGPNSAGSTTQQSTVRATVRDSANNLVKNAPVDFSIQADGSGGSLSSPSSVRTGSDGVASVNYIAGTSTTAANGVTIRAKIAATSSAQADVALTVAKSALFISAGTGSAIATPSSTTYSKEYVVFVTDSSGGPAANVGITVSVLPRNYYKGTMFFAGTEGPWTPAPTAVCGNEDLNQNGVLDTDEDFNTDGFLTPGIPVTVTSSAKTDANGMATFTFTYARDRALWLDIDFTVRGTVSGTEATYVGYTLLGGLGSDYSNKAVTPPGVVSPYGQASACNDKN